MLWVFIDNTGTIICNVSVGNRVRQGNPFSMFICFEGGASSANGYVDNSIFGVRNVSYIRPDMSTLLSTYVNQPSGLTQETFNLGNPSEMNSCFVNGVTYLGYRVDFLQETTTFDGNGGHMAVLVSMFRKSHPDDMSYDQRAQMLSLFIEPVYGQKPSKLTLGDYDLLMSLWRNSSNVSLGVIEDESILDQFYYIKPTPDNPNPVEPNAFYTYVYEGMPYFLFVAYDEENEVTIQQRIGFIRSEDGNYVTYATREFDGSWSEWEQEYSNPISNIVNVRSVANPYGLVKNTITISLIDGKSYSFDFYDGVGIASITVQESQQDGGENVVSVRLTNGTLSRFSVKNGNTGAPCLGNIGVTMVIVTESNYASLGFTEQNAPFGHLLIFYSDIEEQPSGYYLVSEDNLASLAQYGVTSDDIGHLIHVTI